MSAWASLAASVAFMALAVAASPDVELRVQHLRDVQSFIVPLKTPVGKFGAGGTDGNLRGITEVNVGPQRTVAAVQPGAVISMGTWRTPHPAPANDNPAMATGLSGAMAIHASYDRNGKVLFFERPRGYTTLPNGTQVPNPNPYIENTQSLVGVMGSIYQPSYYNNNPAVPNATQDTFIPMDTQSEAFCSGHVRTSRGDLLIAGGDWLFPDVIFRSTADRNANPPFYYPNGFHDIRLISPGQTAMTITANMYDINTVTGQPNTAASCCVQTRGATPITANCVPDPACAPRWYPTMVTMPSGNALIVGGCKISGGGGDINEQTPSYMIYNVSTNTVGRTMVLPSTILTDAFPNALYPILFILPPTGSLLVIVGYEATVFRTYNDGIVSVDATYGTVPSLPYIPSFPYLTANVMLPLVYPNFTPEILLMGGSDTNLNGVSTSLRISGLVPGGTPTFTTEQMGTPRIEGHGVNLPDGRIFMCHGAQQGRTGGTYNAGNGFTNPVTFPQIYTPTAPVGSRWSGNLTDSGIARLYHSMAQLTISGEVMVAGSETTGEYRVQYYVPDYLTSGNPRPVITTAPTVIAYGSTFTVAYTLSSGSIARVALVRLSTSTHSLQMDQRMVQLGTTTITPTLVTCLAPPNATVAPPGDYMLFLLSPAGTPSIAVFTRVNGTFTSPGPPPATVDTIASGGTLTQSVGLFSANGQYFAVAQPDGSFLVYNTLLYKNEANQPTSAVFSAGTAGSGSAPYLLTMRTDCNLVLTGSTGTVLFQSGTSGHGTAPCHAQMRNDGTLAVIDNTGAVLYSTPLLPLAPGRYTIQSIGTAAEGNPNCGTYMGYTACGGGTNIVSLPSSSPVIAWDLAQVGTTSRYTIRAVTREGCGGASYLSTSPCSTGSNAVFLAATDDGTGNSEWQLAPLFNRLNAFQLLPGNRASCNEFLSTTTCAGGPAIDIYFTDDGSGRQQWLFSPVATLPLNPGSYTIQSVGTAAENNPACATYMGYNGCGGATTIPSLQNTVLSSVTWDVTSLGGSLYTLRAQTLESCSPASPTYLGALPCSSGSNQVALASANDNSGNQEWLLSPTATPMVFDVLVQGRGTCNTYLSTTTCAGGPHIDIYFTDDGSGRQQWKFTPTTAVVLAPGRYFIQSVGTAAENNPNCATYMGYNACGGATTIPSLFNTSAASITWDVALVSGSTYTLRAFYLETCSPASPTYLSGPPCSSGSNQLALGSADDGTGDQRWQLQPVSGMLNTFDVVNTGRPTCNQYLSTTTCAGGPHLDIFVTDDGSGRQRWLFTPASSTQTIPDGLYTIRSVGTAAENNAQCGTYFGAQPCGGSAQVLAYTAVGTSAVWNVTHVVGGAPNLFHFVNLARQQCAQAGLLNAEACGTNTVDITTVDDGTSGRQRWSLAPAGPPNAYNILAGGRSGCNMFLSTTVCASGPIFDIYFTDDGSGRQQWLFAPYTPPSGR